MVTDCLEVLALYCLEQRREVGLTQHGHAHLWHIWRLFGHRARADFLLFDAPLEELLQRAEAIGSGARLELREEVLREQLHVGALHQGRVLWPVAVLEEDAELAHRLHVAGDGVFGAILGAEAALERPSQVSERVTNELGSSAGNDAQRRFTHGSHPML
jgi:hypothetical protein